MRTYSRDSASLVFVIQPTEDLEATEVKVTDQATGAIKYYWFFGLTGGEYEELLLDGLEAGHTYLINWTMMDKSGKYKISDMGFFQSTEAAKDEVPPEVSEQTVVERTETVATLHLVTNELLRKMKAQYRITGTEEWFEQAMLETNTTYDPVLQGLHSGVAYEYRYVLEDLSGNQLITDWELL